MCLCVCVYVAVFVCVCVYVACMILSMNAACPGATNLYGIHTYVCVYLTGQRSNTHIYVHSDGHVGPPIWGVRPDLAWNGKIKIEDAKFYKAVLQCLMHASRV